MQQLPNVFLLLKTLPFIGWWVAEKCMYVHTWVWCFCTLVKLLCFMCSCSSVHLDHVGVLQFLWGEAYLTKWLSKWFSSRYLILEESAHMAIQTKCLHLSSWQSSCTGCDSFGSGKQIYEETVVMDRWEKGLNWLTNSMQVNFYADEQGSRWLQSCKCQVYYSLREVFQDIKGIPILNISGTPTC